METLSITFPEQLRVALDREAKIEHTKRSTLIQKAVKMYLDVKARKGLRARLKAECQNMAEANALIMKEFEQADNEAWKHVP